MRFKSLTFSLLHIAFFLIFSANLRAADLAVGKTLFITNCASCHAKSMKEKLTGPALAGVRERWGDDKALYSWIRNSQALIAAGYPRAVQIYAENNKSNMSAFPSFKDEDIDNLMLYIETTAKGGPKEPTTPENGGATVEAGDDHTLLYGVAFFILAGLALVLSSIMNNLNRNIAEKEGKPYVERTWTDVLTGSTVKGFLIFGLIVFGGFKMVNNAISLGRTQNYAPEQPIKFSHATHAGLNKIDCQYCHDGARRSKQSVIPATNTCMNCHKAIKVGSRYKTAELTKIYASIGFEPNSGTYIPNYDNLSEEEVSGIFKKWIALNYRTERKIDTTAKVSADERMFVDDQWNNIASSLKTEYKTKVQGPIEWKRLHNLPDHVYFNHAQHVAVGKVECQTCHGTVEKMEVMTQHSPLSMGWCINCHRQTEVKFAENDYYKSYERYHEELKKGTREKVTVEDIGGLECQKCHY